MFCMLDVLDLEFWECHKKWQQFIYKTREGRLCKVGKYQYGGHSNAEIHMATKIKTKVEYNKMATQRKTHLNLSKSGS